MKILLPVGRDPVTEHMLSCIAVHGELRRPGHMDASLAVVLLVPVCAAVVPVRLIH